MYIIVVRHFDRHLVSGTFDSFICTRSIWKDAVQDSNDTTQIRHDNTTKYDRKRAQCKCEPITAPPPQPHPSCRRCFSPNLVVY